MYLACFGVLLMLLSVDYRTGFVNEWMILGVDDLLDIISCLRYMKE